MADKMQIIRVDVWPLRIPLAQPYHLSRLYGTLTHSDAVLVRLTLADGSVGWGEADPGGINFDGETLDSTTQTLRARVPEVLGQSVNNWVETGKGREYQGAAAAAVDVACYDALGRATQTPVCRLLGEQCHSQIPVLWPTSSGSADDDLAVIDEYHAHGFNTYMLKMGDKPASEDIVRIKAVIPRLPEGVRVMVDANQGWDREEALAFAGETASLPLILIEQPVTASDHEGLRMVRELSGCPVSVDESIQKPDETKAILEAEAADVFSIKISKNGGLANSLAIAQTVRDAGKQVLMNSMIELGITQAASLHLGCTLNNLVDCGHAYMSTLRMSDDVTNFSSWIKRGVANLAEAPGLGVDVSLKKIKQYQVDHFYVN
jgi:muconate cycloisomerase